MKTQIINTNKEHSRMNEANSIKNTSQGTIQDTLQNQRLGNPMDFNTLQAEKTNINTLQYTTKPLSQTEKTLREEDSGLGVPQSHLEAERVLSVEETKAHQKAEEERIRKEAEELLNTMSTDNGWLMPKAVQRAFSITLLLIASILSIMIITDTIQFFANIQSFSINMQWLCIALFVLFSCIIIYIIFKLFGTIIQLQRSPRINLKALKTLSERQDLQKIAQEKQAEAKQMLEKYLTQYPLTQKQEAKFIAFGLHKTQWENLLVIHKNLLLNDTPVPPEDWCMDFQENFQTILDNMAKGRVKAYAKRCALGTAIMPFSLIDRLIVFYSSISMIKDLLIIYNLKPSMGQSTVIFAKAIIAIYLSGIIEENTELAAESLSETLKNNLPEGSLESITGTIGTSINAKAAEAALNYFFLNRLGKKTIQLLQATKA